MFNICSLMDSSTKTFVKLPKICGSYKITNIVMLVLMLTSLLPFCVNHMDLWYPKFNFHFLENTKMKGIPCIQDSFFDLVIYLCFCFGVRCFELFIYSGINVLI